MRFSGSGDSGTVEYESVESDPPMKFSEDTIDAIGDVVSDIINHDKEIGDWYNGPGGQGKVILEVDKKKKQLTYRVEVSYNHERYHDDDDEKLEGEFRNAKLLAVIRAHSYLDMMYYRKAPKEFEINHRGGILSPEHRAVIIPIVNKLLSKHLYDARHSGCGLVSFFHERPTDKISYYIRPAEHSENQEIKGIIE